MGRRRNVVAVVVAAGLTLGACGGSDDAGVVVDEISTPAESAPSLETPPSVAKAGRVEMEVPRAEVDETAQAVVDLATSPKIGGLLTSSVVDLAQGYGFATILVQVPAERFESTMAGLGEVGAVTRQEMVGESLVDEDVTVAQRSGAAARAAYAPIDVAITGRPPAPPPPQSSISHAVATAKDISLGMASGVIVAAGAVVPAGVVLLALYLVLSFLIRRLRPRAAARASES